MGFLSMLTAKKQKKKPELEGGKDKASLLAG